VQENYRGRVPVIFDPLLAFSESWPALLANRTELSLSMVRFDATTPFAVYALVG